MLPSVFARATLFAYELLLPCVVVFPRRPYWRACGCVRAHMRTLLLRRVPAKQLKARLRCNRYYITRIGSDDVVLDLYTRSVLVNPANNGCSRGLQ